MKKILICTAIALSISGCVNTLKDINGGLSTINNGLSTVNSTLAGRSTTLTPQQNNSASITPSQIGSIQSSLKQKTGDSNIDKDIFEASPVITDFISMISCMTGYNGSVLNRYAASGKEFSDIAYMGAPVPQMHYHNKSSCATVLRIQGWRMPARNALQFEVSYISDTSGEVVKRDNEIVKQANGEWLFTR
jgi:hypothetical protein